MNLTQIYRKLIPEKIRKYAYQAFVKQILDFSDFIKYKSYYFLNSVLPLKSEKHQCYVFMGKHKPVVYPYPYYFKYMKMDISCFWDSDSLLPYVNHNGRKLFFRKMNENHLLESYKLLLMEQNQMSAHCYIENYAELKGKTIVDVGAAEGIFSLNAIEYAEHIYLFECEKSWIQPLKETFKMFKDKVTIVEKYVSDVTEGDFITLDDFFCEGIPENLFIKMDIEGFERKALKGCKNIIAISNNVSGAICTYHKYDDERVITAYFDNLNCKTSKTKGYVYNERELRNGVIRFQKNKLKTE